jgi:hypothetical protein
VRGIVYVLPNPLDPNPDATRYNTGQSREQEIAYLCGICPPLQHPAITDRTLVMSRGKRFESARRLLICAEIGEPYQAKFGGSPSPAIDDSCDDNPVWTTVNSRAHVWFTIRSSTPVSVQSGAAVNTSILTENHGVPGSNPGPATPKSPANR